MEEMISNMEEMISNKRRCHRREASRWSLIGWATTLVALSALCVSAAGAAPASPPKGAFCGQVIDTAGGKPVAGATVALRDRRGRVLAWTKTDAQGRYTLAADSLALLDLPTARRRGMLAAIGRGVVEVVKLPVKAAGAVVSTATDAVKAVDPVGTLKAVAVGTLAGTPMPLAAKAAGDLQNLTGAGTRQTARTNAAEAVVNGSPAAPAAEKPKDMPGPGEVGLLVSAPQCKEFRGPVGAYWMTAPERGDKGGSSGPQAWLDTVRLASAAGDKSSDVQDQAPRLADPTLDAALAAAGSPVKITVRLPLPADPVMKVRVIAREQKTRHVTELLPQGGLYAGTLALDPKTPTGDTTLTIVALKATPVDVALRPGKGDPLLAWAAQRENLDADKPYHFDPRIMASENRLDLKMTILDPKQENPPPTTPAPGTPPAPAPPVPAVTPAPVPAATPAPAVTPPAPATPGH